MVPGPASCSETRGATTIASTLGIESETDSPCEIGRTSTMVPRSFRRSNSNMREIQLLLFFELSVLSSTRLTLICAARIPTSPWIWSLSAWDSKTVSISDIPDCNKNSRTWLPGPASTTNVESSSVTIVQLPCPTSNTLTLTPPATIEATRVALLAMLNPQLPIRREIDLPTLQPLDLRTRGT